MRPATASRKARSWVTTTNAKADDSSLRSRSSIAARSRWFVGSSSSTRSAASARQRASAAFLIMPPDIPSMLAPMSGRPNSVHSDAKRLSRRNPPSDSIFACNASTARASVAARPDTAAS